ncbi:MAG: hypothetical protein LBB61_10315 [Treponema sp.]|jgi:hypothetical protein|nr:hypothetical protein [Treponema sp.]
MNGSLKRAVRPLFGVVSAVFFTCFPMYIWGADEWSLLNETQGKDQIVTVLSGPGGRTASVISAAALGRSDIAAIGSSLNTVWAIPGLKGTDASARLDSDGFRLVAYPTSFIAGGRDLMPFLPSGLSFYFRTSLFYDISLKVNDFIPKVTGAYVSPEGLIRHVSAAILIPEMYLYDQSLMERIERLENALMAALKKAGPTSGVSSEIVRAVANICNENPGITPEAALKELKTRKFKTSIKEVRAVYFVLFGGL